MLGCKACVGEHAFLPRDKTEIAFGSDLFHGTRKCDSHCADAIAHAVHFVFPSGFFHRVRQDIAHDSGAVKRGIGVTAAHEAFGLS